MILILKIKTSKSAKTIKHRTTSSAKLSSILDQLTTIQRAAVSYRSPFSLQEVGLLVLEVGDTIEASYSRRRETEEKKAIKPEQDIKMNIKQRAVMQLLTKKRIFKQHLRKKRENMKKLWQDWTNIRARKNLEVIMERNNQRIPTDQWQSKGLLTAGRE